MSFGRFRSITPMGAPMDPDDPGAGSGQARVEAYEGTQIVKRYGVTAEGAGTWAKGRITGTILAYDYMAIYQVYGLTQHEPVEAWVAQYKQDATHTELIRVFQESMLLPIEFDIQFQIEGNDLGVAGVYLTYRVIRLAYTGVVKDFVVTSASGVEVTTTEGQRYPGGFQLVE